MPQGRGSAGYWSRVLERTCQHGHGVAQGQARPGGGLGRGALGDKGQGARKMFSLHLIVTFEAQ